MVSCRPEVVIASTIKLSSAQKFGVEILAVGAGYIAEMYDTMKLSDPVNCFEVC